MNLEKLVKSAQNNNPDALEELLKRFYKMATGYAYSLLGDFDTVEDVVQESIVDVCCNIQKLKIPNAFPAWFKKIIYNNANSHCRKRPVS